MKLLQAKETFEPLYKKGDRFKFLSRSLDKDLLPIRAFHLKSRKIYAFEEHELEEMK